MKIGDLFQDVKSGLSQFKGQSSRISPTALFGSAASAASGLAGSALNYFLGNKMMNKQFEMQKEMFNMQNERQNWLMLNSEAMQKEALRRAGYSTADPNGTGVDTPAAMTGQTPSYPGNIAQDIRFDPIGTYAQLKSAELNEIQKKDVEASAKLKETQAVGQSITNKWIAPRSEAEVKNTLQEIENLRSQKKLTDVQADTAERLCKATEKMTDAQCKQIDQMIENAKVEYRRIQEQIELLRVQQTTERSVQAYNRAAAYNQFQSGQLSHEMRLGQKWRNLADEYNAGLVYLKQEEQRIRNNLRKDLADAGIDMENRNILSMIGQQVAGTVTHFKRGYNRARNKVMNLRIK